ncbi:hypothetical protein Glove_66g130 [Diversispora epigaea]|uniref:TLDc domain-containing protein n=1 Tax=Diversispora epigaea TaxID=1348612 RepID=A0A397JHF1_9GLOM|nr:hypothetical protein Glove_66g130 [Diversispora epigaea]
MDKNLRLFSNIFTMELLTENIDAKIIYELMITANEFKLEELSEKLESHLFQFEASWLKTNSSFIYHSISINNEFKNLKKFCDNIIVKDPKLIFESAEFDSLYESALVLNLKRDDLQMKESEIWTQKLILPEELKEWSRENFTTLKTTLQQCLPLIRYFHITNSDVMDKIRPHKKILDEQLWNDLKQHLILPDRPQERIAPEKPTQLPKVNSLSQIANEPEPFSTIINENHAAIISSWINRNPTSYSLSNNPYVFKLILRGIKGSEEIIGGFNPLAWDKTKEDWMRTNNSFIFSFKDIKDENFALHFHCNKDEVGSRFGRAELMLKSCKFDFTNDCLSVKIRDFMKNHLEKVKNEVLLLEYNLLKVLQ